MPCGCKGYPQITDYGSMVCPACGVEDLSQMWMTDTTFVPRGALQCTGTYTRQKRFRKYVHRTAMHQSATCVPNETWRYLLDRGPYSGPRDIVARLKRLRRSSMKKCYDCLPYLTSVLCPHLQVPHLDEPDKNDAICMFRKLDYEYTRGEPLVSYLYALEYILVLIGRGDMLPYINKIQCRKRRAAYKERLDRVFRDSRPQNA